MKVKVFGDVVACIPLEQYEDIQRRRDLLYTLFGDSKLHLVQIPALDCVFVAVDDMRFMVTANARIRQFIPSWCITYRARQTVNGEAVLQLDAASLVDYMETHHALARVFLNDQIKPLSKLPGGAWNKQQWIQNAAR